MSKVFIVAEAGVNHNGDTGIARRMVDAAVDAGADAVKFQTFDAAKVASPSAPKADYQKRASGSGKTQLEMLKGLELGREAHEELISYCRRKGIMFLSTPFDLGSVDMLYSMGLKIFKIPSGEITNLPYLRKVGGLRRKIIMSTGMSCLREVGDALCVLETAGTPKKNITVLHCNTGYPTQEKDVNLMAMLTIRDSFRVKIGYSDHTLGIEVPIAAAALGASVIEKHFTLDRKMTGPDHKASLEPDELARMVEGIRKVEKALGDGVKRPTGSESVNMECARRSLVAAKPVKKGETFTEDMITAKRPGTGINPMELDKVLGKKAKRDFREDDLIEL